MSLIIVLYSSIYIYSIALVPNNPFLELLTKVIYKTIASGPLTTLLAVLSNKAGKKLGVLLSTLYPFNV
jgi:hypothetical protein